MNTNTKLLQVNIPTAVIDNQVLQLVQSVKNTINPLLASFDALKSYNNLIIKSVDISPLLATINSMQINFSDIHMSNESLATILQSYNNQIGSLSKNLHQGVNLHLQNFPLENIHKSLAELRINVWLPQLQILAESINVPALVALSQQIANLHQLNGLNNIHNVAPIGSVTHEISTLLYDATLNESNEISEDLVNRITNEITRQIEELSSTSTSKTITAKTIFDILLGVITFLSVIYQVYDGYQTDLKFSELIQGQATIAENIRTANVANNENSRIAIENLEKIVEIEEKILAQLPPLLESPEPKELVVTKKSCVLRSEPNKKGPIMTRLFPNQVLEPLSTHNGWIYVTYFDYRDGLPKTGWVYQKNVTKYKVKPASQQSN